MTKKIPRSGSAWNRSSLFSRFRPGSLNPAQFSREITAICLCRSWCKERKRTTLSTRERSSGMGIATTRASPSASTLIRGLEIQEDRIGQSDDGARRDRRLQIPVPVLAVLGFQASWNAFAIDRGPELTYIFKKELACRWISANPAMLAAHI